MLFFTRKKVARFEKVSYEEFKKRFNTLFPYPIVNINKIDAYPDIVTVDIQYRDNIFINIYNNITLPARQTIGAAAYDFYSPFDFCLKVGESITIPSGIKIYMKPGWGMIMSPRSSHGLNGITFENKIPIIDSDYYNNEKTEGHILIKITNENKYDKEMQFYAGERIVQGMIIPYGIALNEVIPKKKRIGTSGSTSH